MMTRRATRKIPRRRRSPSSPSTSTKTRTKTPSWTRRPSAGSCAPRGNRPSVSLARSTTSRASAVPRTSTTRTKTRTTTTTTARRSGARPPRPEALGSGPRCPSPRTRWARGDPRAGSSSASASLRVWAPAEAAHSWTSAPATRLDVAQPPDHPNLRTSRPIPRGSTPSTNPERTRTTPTPRRGTTRSTRGTTGTRTKEWPQHQAARGASRTRASVSRRRREETTRAPVPSTWTP
mmetsp:Transcript_12345/g.49544  ORF Transcript_12345/g.49544 Transcript_12345/m.49544 type:complete len:235 (-) Transcript_12345:976-1680(-)